MHKTQSFFGVKSGDAYSNDGTSKGFKLNWGGGWGIATVKNKRTTKLTSKSRGTSDYQLNCFFCVVVVQHFPTQDSTRIRP